jgi:CopG family nickel-responsive transcriptional regulator
VQRVTISLDDQLARDFDALSRQESYASRSEAVRDLVRDAVEARRLADNATGECVANLSYVYNHATRDLSQRLSDAGHRHHGLVVSTTHVHLDHDDCLETSILKGPVAAVRAFANAVRAERGVRFAQLNLVRVEPNDHHGAASPHAHGGHQHLTPARG